MNAIQSTPAFKGRNQFNRPFPQLSPEQQIEVLVRTLGDEAQHRHAGVEPRHRSVRRKTCLRAIATLRQQGFAIQNLLKLGGRHVEVLVNAWLQSGVAPATIHSRLSVLRWLTRSLDKRGVVHSAEHYGVPPAPRASDSAIADAPSSADGRRVEALIAALSGWAGTVIGLMREFDLSLTQALLFRPRVSDSGGSALVEEGSRRRRGHVVAIHTESQRAALEAAHAFAKTTPRDNLVPDGLTFPQARRRFYYHCNLAGLSAPNGVTPGALRGRSASPVATAPAG